MKRLDHKIIEKEVNNSGCLLLSQYENAHIKLKIRCVCKIIFYKTFRKFNITKRCTKCSRETCNKNKIKYDYEYVKNFFEKNGRVLLTKKNKYKNSHQKLRTKCICGRVNNITFMLFKVKNGKIVCTKCAGKLYRSGENNIRYNKNLTEKQRKENKKGNFSKKYCKWRAEIYKRFNYKCQKCFNIGGILNAHHIFNKSSYPKLKYKWYNGIILCVNCHKEFHKEFGMKNNNMKQLRLFLKR